MAKFADVGRSSVTRLSIYLIKYSKSAKDKKNAKNDGSFGAAFLKNVM